MSSFAVLGQGPQGPPGPPGPPGPAGSVQLLARTRRAGQFPYPGTALSLQLGLDIGTTFTGLVLVGWTIRRLPPEGSQQINTSATQVLIQLGFGSEMTVVRANFNSANDDDDVPGYHDNGVGHAVTGLAAVRTEAIGDDGNLLVRLMFNELDDGSLGPQGLDVDLYAIGLS